MTISKEIPEELQDIIVHLREPSFNAFITWKRNTCLIKDLERFKLIVLSTFNHSYSFDDFYQIIQSFSLKQKLTPKHYVIHFSDSRYSQSNHKKITNPILKNLEYIEEKQEKLFKVIQRVQKKLEKAIQINSHLKQEIFKSESNQKILFESHRDILDDSAMMYGNVLNT